MNCLCEAIGMAMPGNGTVLAIDPKRQELYNARPPGERLGDVFHHEEVLRAGEDETAGAAIGIEQTL